MKKSNVMANFSMKKPSIKIAVFLKFMRQELFAHFVVHAVIAV